MARRIALLLGFTLGLAAHACVLPNPDHCQNRAVDPNAWCAQAYADERPYCSPCAADNDGCVASEPSEDECPAYVPSPATETGGTEDTGGAETGGTETGGTGETETG